MTQERIYIVIILSALTVGLFITLFYIAMKKRPAGSRYDERQQLARGRAYKAAFLVLAVYSIIQGFIASVLGVVWCDTLTGAFIGFCLSLTVFVTFCILNDAYVALKENPKTVITILGVVSIGNLVGGAGVILRGDYLNAEGQLTYGSMNFVVAATLILTLAVFIAKRLHDRKNAETE